MPKFHYSIHGSEAEGWSLMVYQYAPDKHSPDHDTIAPYWATAKTFDTLEDVLTEMSTLEQLNLSN